MFYGLDILVVTVLMRFSSKTVGGNEKSYSFPPLQPSNMIHMGLYTASRREKKKDKNLSLYIDIRGGETLTTDYCSSSSSMRFLMPDLNVWRKDWWQFITLQNDWQRLSPGPRKEQELEDCI